MTHAKEELPDDANCANRQPVTPDFFQTSAADSSDPAVQLLAGLAAAKAHIPAWYLYDNIGSRLFEVITALPDYYPTRTEAAILTEHLPTMAAATPLHGGTLIDLGAGSCEKAPRLFPIIKPRQYVPVDISVDYLHATLTHLQREHPDVQMLGVGTDFSQSLVLPECVHRDRRLFFYPGSSIGNFTPNDATDFLRRVGAEMPGDGALWIGIDLIKDTATLERAYDDELGVTAAFNRNMLNNVNRLTGTNFVPRTWRHVACFNTTLSRVEMHLEATQAMTVTWPDGERTFSVGERIHTESSYKYTPETFRALLERAGLRAVDMWTDEKQHYAFFAAVLAQS